jgi:hypothetical protein
MFGLNKVLTGRAYLDMTSAQNLRFLRRLRDNKQTAWAFSNREFYNLEYKSMQLVIKAESHKCFPKSYGFRRLRSVLANRKFQLLPLALRRRILLNLSNSPENVFAIPHDFSSLKNFVGRAATIKKLFGNATGTMILKIAAEHPNAIVDINSFISTGTFRDADYDFHNVAAATKRSKLERKAMMLRMIATLSMHEKRVKGDWMSATR